MQRAMQRASDKEVFICVIHDHEVYNGFHGEATLHSCKKFIDAVFAGKQKNSQVFFAKGIVVNEREGNVDNKVFEVFLTKIYWKDGSSLTAEGRCSSYSELWIKSGKYARELFLSENPSRRKLIEGLE